MQRASNYQNRIKTLQMPGGITGPQNEQNVPKIKSSEQLDQTVARTMVEE